jgi:predicted nucleic acid-binding protein
MPHLGDTNILLRFTNANDPEHELVRDAVRALLLQGEGLYYTQQNRREYWNVCTRPAERNGLGYTILQAQQRLAGVDAVFQRLPGHPDSGPIWDRLVIQYAAVGVAVHDAQLVASTLAHGIPTILTLNDADFPCYAAEVAAVHPSAVLPPVGPGP